MLDLTQFDGITKGEWRVSFDGALAVETADGREIVIDRHVTNPNRRAIAAIPAMIAEIRRLREERDRYHTALANIVRHMEIVVGGNMPSTVATIASNALSRKEAP